MSIGLAIYNTAELSPVHAYELGESFFKSLDIPITDAGYYTYLSDGDHPGDHDIVEIPFAELKGKLLSGEATAFRIYSQKSGHSPWLGSFGYSTPDFSSFCHLDAQFPGDSLAYKEALPFIEQLTARVKYPYGILYACEKTSQAFYYATGDNMVSVFPYENPMTWGEELPGLYEGQERYTGSRLRMVYPYNLINDDHLQILIENMPLKEWILSTKEHGSLAALEQGIWAWEVEEQHLEHINQACGNAGILIAWKAPRPAKAGRKLP